MNPFPILNAKELLTKLELESAISEWRSLSGLDNKVFDVLLLEPLHKFAEAVQLAPASEAHHHCGAGGLLTHTVDVITIALKKRRGYQLPLGGSITDINHQRHLWTYGVFVACLLHDIGKISGNIRLVLILKDDSEKIWTPHDEPLTAIKQAMGYHIQFEKTPYNYHRQIALTHFDFISRIARAWLAQAPMVMAQLCAFLWGDKFESGIIGEIAEFADRESTARDLKIPSAHRLSDAVSAIDRYLRMMRQWIADGAIKINTNGGMGWVDNNGNCYLVCRSLAEKIIQECASLNIKNLPQDHVRIYDILQDHGYALSTPEGKAVWTIQVKTESFTHQFTCLKFEARKLSPSSKLLSPLSGEITILDAKSHDTNKSEQEAIAQSADEKTIDANGGIAAQRQNEILATEGSNDTDNKIADALSSAETETKYKISETANAFEHEDKNHDSADTEERYQEAESENRNTPTINIEATDTPRRFLSWLKKGLIEKTILINDVNAEVHIVEEGVFLLAPAIFKSFLNKHGLSGESQHKNLSRRFARLRVHVKAGDVNIHSYWVCASNRASKINGWLIPFNAIYENDYPIPKTNKYIRKTLDSP
jgi:integrating conjugative element relaxase (TIGR03760 family)